jgi:hypothetical protein
MKWNSLLITLLGLAAACRLPAQTAPAQPDPWPRVFVQGGATNTIYQPQVDSWDGFLLKARTAVAVQPVGTPEPVFGVVELSARTLVDKVQRTVQLDQIQITSAKFPSAPDREPAYLEQLCRVLPAGARTIALDRLEANLAILEESKKGQAVPIENQPPRIIVSQQAALLVLVDGPPAWRPVEGTALQRVLNTRVLLLKDAAGRCYLHLWDGYLEAASLDGPWSVTQTISSDLKKAAKLAGDSGQVDLLPAQEDPDTKKTPSLKTIVSPVIYTATGPADLILIDGTPNWVPIADTMLLYVANTASDVFKNMNDQQTYLLLSGRWFHAPSFDGPWQYVPGESLPPDFANMPDASPKENVKASIPGTPQAQEMLIANGIPQTAEVPRDTKLDPPPQVDGAPQLQAIPSTQLSYVINSPTPIIRVDDRSWYVCQNGVWYFAPSSAGPWFVATAVPPVIYSIPPTCPVHYVTYVRISTVTPTVVYVGYTPGYMGAVVSPSGVVVYGTGYYYTPWVGTVYVTPPVTYGYCAVPAWSPWAGWAFGFAIGWAASSSYHGCYCRPPPPCWGPYWGHWHGGSHGSSWGGVAVWGPGGWAATSGNIYHRSGSWYGTSRVQGGYNASTGNRWATQYGHAYNSRTGTIAAGQRGAVQNVYTGNYAYGGRGAAYNPNTGVAAAGGKFTVGNTRTGNEATAGRVTVSTPGSGSTTISGVKGDNGGIYKVGNQVVAGKDGNIYRPSGSGGWEQATPAGKWQGVQDTQRTQSLQRETQARNVGQQRSQSFDSFRSNAGAYQRSTPSLQSPAASGGSRGGGRGR